MNRSLRKFNLTAHVVFSVGWLGAVIPYAVLAVAGLRSEDIEFIRSTYATLNFIGWFSIVPLCIVAVLSGLIQSWTTEWGFFKHYWVVAKLLLSAIATAILMIHMRTVSRMAALVSIGTTSSPDFEKLRVQLVIHAIGGLLVLVFITGISIYKPWGRTKFPRKVTSSTN